MVLRLSKTISLIILSVLLAFIVFVRVSEDSKIESTDNSSARVKSPLLEEGEAIDIEPSEREISDPYSDRPEVDITLWQLKLVNSGNLLDEDFKPELIEIINGQSFDSRASEQLLQFTEAARSAGNKVYIMSSYRSYNVQKSLFEIKVSEYLSSEGSRAAAEKKARTIVSCPGSSEHQLGLACDITDGYYEYMNESLENTELFKWLSEHCAEYGFILRYPKEKQDITGIMYEPWHFRYVGKEAAEYITEKGLCLEEFLELYK